MKRTKRYGGFLVGDRVRCQDLEAEGVVTGLTEGGCVVTFDIKANGEIFEHDFFFLPRSLINLTRQEEEAQERVITFSPSDLPDTPLEQL